MFAFQRTVSRLTEMQTEEYWVEGDRSTTWPHWACATALWKVQQTPVGQQLLACGQTNTKQCGGGGLQVNKELWSSTLSHCFLMPVTFTPLTWKGEMISTVLPLQLGTFPQFSEGQVCSVISCLQYMYAWFRFCFCFVLFFLFGGGVVVCGVGIFQVGSLCQIKVSWWWW